jgi:glycosyltransferase involved in cell wall biosynthesis
VRLTVAIASHERPLRLRWLLNALEEQTLPRSEFEVVVCHDSAGEETDRLLRSHPLAPVALRLPVGTASAARQRNAAWSAGRAPVVVFTDDDCRPPPEWLELMAAAVERHPGAVVQGAVRPDPLEEHLLYAAPHARSLRVDPPGPWGQCANIAYPRSVLEHLGGFDERFSYAAGEDTDLALRAIEAGVPYVGAPDALTYHAVAPYGLVGALRTLPRWGEVARVVRRHPRVRRRLALGVFWKASHAWLLAALVARPALLGWALAAAPRYGRSPRGLARAATELPARAVLDAVEIAVLARASLRERTLIL